MNTPTNAIEKIIAEGNRFAITSLGVHPDAVFADVHDSSIMITLHDILPLVEKEHIEEQHIAELVSRNYKASYDAVRHTFEATLSKLIEHKVDHSSFFIDAKASCGTILCTVST